MTDTRRFEVSFSGIDWVANFEKTRWFLVLRLGKPDAGGLNKLLHVSNKVVQDYGQLPLYTSSGVVKHQIAGDNGTGPPKRISSRSTSSAKKSVSGWNNMLDASDAFHISIAWTLSAPNNELIELTKSMVFNQFAEIQHRTFKVEEIKCKVGNVVTRLPLSTGVVEGQGLFGL